MSEGGRSERRTWAWNCLRWGREVGVEERAACRAVELSGTGIVGSVVTVDILFRIGGVGGEV